MIPMHKIEQEEELRNLERYLITKLAPNLNRRVKEEQQEKNNKRNRPRKRGKKEKKIELIKNSSKMMWTWTCDGRESMNFKDVIERRREPIYWQRGILDMTDWKQLKKQYRIEVSVNQEFGDQKFLQKKMKENSQGILRIMMCTRRDKETENEIREKVKEGLENLPEATLVRIWRKRK